MNDNSKLQDQVSMANVKHESQSVAIFSGPANRREIRRRLDERRHPSDFQIPNVTDCRLSSMLLATVRVRSQQLFLQ